MIGFVDSVITRLKTLLGEAFYPVYVATSVPLVLLDLVLSPLRCRMDIVLRGEFIILSYAQLVDLYYRGMELI